MLQRPGMQCIQCNKTLPIDLFALSCPVCDGKLLIVYDFASVGETTKKTMFKNQKAGVWKYFELLPINTSSNIVSLGEGGTFLQKCDGLTKALGVEELYLKNETTNPTGSFIDRGMTVLVSKALEAGVQSLGCISTGNLGASLAAYVAKAGITCQIRLSPEINLGKLYQIIACNANIQFDDDQTTSPRNERKNIQVTPSNPFLIEGEKTIAYEICEQLDWYPPSRIILPMGTGGLTSMIWKGLQELMHIGFIDHASSMITGVQADGCCPIVEAYRYQHEEITPSIEPKTLAIDIQVGDPPFGKLALKAIRASKGTAIAVSDREIVEAIRLLAKTEGVFAEPSAASTIAGLKKLVEGGKIENDEKVVCIITGAGLKDPSVIESLVEHQKRIKMFMYGVEQRRLTKLGKTKLLILQILSEQELHGYGIWKSLKEEHSVKISVPSVYQHLLELEALTLLRKSKAQFVIGKRTRRLCKLTEKGRETLRLNP